jgi:hypothetical protein
MVHVNKPAQVREDPITDKTGGCNNDAGSIGKSFCLQARKGNLSRRKVTGGADFYTKPAQLIGMRKGSVFVRGVAPKGSYAVLVVSGGMRKPRPDTYRKRRFSSPQDERHVVSCIGYAKSIFSN